MSVTGTTQIFFDEGRKYPQLPDGVRPWWGTGAVTGDATAGFVTLPYALNPNSSRSFDQYFTMTRQSLNTSTADPDGAVYLEQDRNSWERLLDSATTPVIGVLAPVDLGAGFGQFAAEQSDVKMLGRVATGTIGALNLYATNVDLMVLTHFIAGFVADYPIIGWNDWRA